MNRSLVVLGLLASTGFVREAFGDDACSAFSESLERFTRAQRCSGACEPFLSVREIRGKPDQVVNGQTLDLSQIVTALQIGFGPMGRLLGRKLQIPFEIGTTTEARAVGAGRQNGIHVRFLLGAGGKMQCNCLVYVSGSSMAVSRLEDSTPPAAALARILQSAGVPGGNGGAGDRPPAPVAGQPYESQAWAQVMWQVRHAWANAFEDNVPCKGARLTGIPGVSFEQARGFRPNAGTDVLPISQADRLNGVEYRARYVITAEATRVFDRGQWTQWAPGFEDAMPHMEGPKVGYFVELKNGQWSAILFGTNMTMRRSALPCGQMPR